MAAPGRARARRQAGVGRGRLRARASDTRSSSWQRRKTTGKEAVLGWAGQLQCWAGWWAAQVSQVSSNPFLFLFLFSNLQFVFYPVLKTKSIL